MSSDSEEEEGEHVIITPTGREVTRPAQINNESFSEDNDDGQSSSSQSDEDPVNSNPIEGGDLSNNVTTNNHPYKRLSINDYSGNRIIGGVSIPPRQYRWIRDVNAMPITAEENGTSYCTNFRGGLRRRRVRNAVFISMDREIGIMTPSHRALRIGRQSAVIVNDLEFGGGVNNARHRSLKLRVEFTEAVFASRP